jgi:integrase
MADPETGWNLISVSRTFWERIEGKTKTKSSTATIPVIPELKEALDVHHKEQQKVFPAAAYIFESPTRPGFPLDISSIGNKQIAVKLAERKLRDQMGGNLWHGLHSFRRGLGNTLKSLGVDETIIKDILRHGGAVTSAVVTEQYYTKAAMNRMQDAMHRVSQAIQDTRRKRKSA